MLSLHVMEQTIADLKAEAAAAEHRAEGTWW
jgi:hypothetical protein